MGFGLNRERKPAYLYVNMVLFNPMQRICNEMEIPFFPQAFCTRRSVETGLVWSGMKPYISS